MWVSGSDGGVRALRLRVEGSQDVFRANEGAQVVLEQSADIQEIPNGAALGDGGKCSLRDQVTKS